jgi:hypothetical protein
MPKGVVKCGNCNGILLMKFHINNMASQDFTTQVVAVVIAELMNAVAVGVEIIWGGVEDTNSVVISLLVTGVINEEQTNISRQIRFKILTAKSWWSAGVSEVTSYGSRTIYESDANAMHKTAMEAAAQRNGDEDGESYEEVVFSDASSVDAGSEESKGGFGAMSLR